MLKLPQRLGLDLPDALAGDRELLTDLFERMVCVRADAEAHAQYPLLARRQRGEHPRGSLAQVRLDGGVDRQDRGRVLDEIAEVGVRLVADRRLERDRLFGDLQALLYLLKRHVELRGKLLRCGLAAELVEHLPPGAPDLVVCLERMDGGAGGGGVLR